LKTKADFFGAMDGASKFVRGDAIAGLLIVFINVIGGIIIGVAQQGMSAGDAAETYTVLSIGDGLVAQIPALLVSTGAALLTTRGDQGNLGGAMAGQLLGRKRPLTVVGAVVLLIGLIPGMPHLLFIGLGAAVLLAASRSRGDDGESTEGPEHASAASDDAGAPPRGDEATHKHELEALLPVDRLSLEVGLELLPLVDANRGGDLLRRIASMRKQLASDLGLIMPPLAIRDDLRLPPGGYRLLLSGVPLAEAKVHAHRVLAIDPSGSATAALPGEATTEPTFGLPAKWLAPSERNRAEAAGCTVVDASAVIATHLTELLRRHAAELLGRRELQQLLDVVARSDAKLVEELLPHHLSTADLLKVLRGLLAEAVSIRDLRTILEALADHAPQIKNPDELVELVRQRLARRLTRAQLSSDGALRPLVLDPRAETALREGTSRHARLLSRLTDDLTARARELASIDEPPLLVVAPDVRRAVAGIAARHSPGLAVLSFREIDPTVPFITRGVVAATEVAA
jgi:flagellar biosynthesis protein FlhA